MRETSPCFFCRTRAKLVHVRWKAIALGSLAFAFLSVNVASALVAYSCTRLTEKMLIAGALLERPGLAAAKRSRVVDAAVEAPRAVAASTPSGAARMMIVQLDANEFTLNRDALDKVLEGQADIMRQTRVAPEMDNGRVVGVRLYGVGPNTLLGALGFENTDVLESINGFDIASPEKALEAYARLRTARDLRVELKRRGAKVELRYHLI